MLLVFELSESWVLLSVQYPNVANKLFTCSPNSRNQACHGPYRHQYLLTSLVLRTLVEPKLVIRIN